MNSIHSDFLFSTHKRTIFCLIIIGISFSMLFLVSCSTLNGYERYDGIDRVAPRQKPPIERVIWSQTDSSMLLVSASEVGFGPTLLDSKVYLLNISTGQIDIIAKTEKGIINGETWSPNRHRVVLYIASSTRGYENYKGLWILDSTTKSMTFLRESGLARWSPYEEIVAIIDNSVSGDAKELHLVDLTLNREEIIPIGNIEQIGYVWDANWSPDGKRIVLSLGDPQKSIPVSLFIFDIEAQTLTLLTGDGNSFFPVWSPDGDKVAYVKRIPETINDSIHLITIDGGCDIELPFIDRAQSLSWSPNGEKLAFISRGNVYIIDMEVFIQTYLGTTSCP